MRRTTGVRASPSSSVQGAVGPVELGRAVLLSLNEARASTDSIEVWLDNKQFNVPREKMTFHPPQDASALVAHLNSAIAAWGEETDWRSLSLKTDPGDGGTLQLTLLLVDKRGRTMEYHYTVSRNDQITADSIVGPRF